MDDTPDTSVATAPAETVQSPENSAPFIAKTETPSAAQAAKNGKLDAKKMAGYGAAIGIGSAAIVAALLYANRNRPPKAK